MDKLNGIVYVTDKLDMLRASCGYSLMSTILTYKNMRHLVLILALLIAALPSVALTTEKSKKAEITTGSIVFLPFTVKTQPPQEHLRAGLTSILATRLTEGTGLEAVHGAHKTGGLEKMLQNGNQLEAKK
ncbi:hypothetical protein VU07_04805, partial [Desulfobulbus sp. F4]|nr:hypothetical protein [Desulfobulbus sp. F4]